MTITCAVFTRLRPPPRFNEFGNVLLTRKSPLYVRTPPRRGRNRKRRQRRPDDTVATLAYPKATRSLLLLAGAKHVDATRSSRSDRPDRQAGKEGENGKEKEKEKGKEKEKEKEKGKEKEKNIEENSICNRGTGITFRSRNGASDRVSGRGAPGSHCSSCLPAASSSFPSSPPSSPPSGADPLCVLGTRLVARLRSSSPFAVATGRMAATTNSSCSSGYSCGSSSRNSTNFSSDSSSGSSSCGSRESGIEKADGDPYIMSGNTTAAAEAAVEGSGFSPSGSRPPVRAGGGPTDD
eukprot:GHVU01027445.1.p1 GENE.GHVU01027445.1~~GHVU01027445.1.p1  ORF type:complete len:294 (+),score=55.49 GHVU01027445.1:2-883(+)